VTTGAPAVQTTITARAGRIRIDGATLGCVYAIALTAIPAKMILKGIPLALTPAAVVGLITGLVWFCTQMVTNLGVAKGRNLVRTTLFIYAATQLATYGYATFGYLPPDELAATDRVLLTVTALIALAIGVCDGVRGMDRLTKLLRVVVVGAAIMAFFGLLQFFVGFDVTKSVSIPGLKPATTDMSYVLERSSFPRPAGTAGHPIEFGVVCAMITPLALHFGFRAKIDGRKRWPWWTATALVAIGSMLSLSRSAILGLVVAAIVLFPGWPAKRRKQMLLATPLFLVIMRLMVPGLLGTLYSLFANISDDPSAQHRTKAIELAGQEIDKHIWLGRGLGTYLPTKYGWLDNQYLGTLVENGLLGLTAFGLLFVIGMSAAFRARTLTQDPRERDLALTLMACLAVPAVSAGTFDLLGFSVASGMTFLLVGACGALLRTMRERRFEPVGLSHDHR
jgi:O-antigen ligase